MRKSAILLISMLFLSGCSADSVQDQSKEIVAKNWLDEKSDAIEEEGKAAFKSLVPSYDEFENTGYFNLPKSLKPKIEFGKIVIHYSLVATDEMDTFRFYPMALVSFLGEDWLFIDSLYLKFGDDVKQFTSKAPYREVLSGANVAEIAAIRFDSEAFVLFLSKVFNVDSVSVRFGGGKVGIGDRVLTEVEMNGLKTVLLAYRYMYQNDLLTTRPTVK
jgi:hypothetical protein